jgi:hypothetical protein
MIWGQNMSSWLVALLQMRISKIYSTILWVYTIVSKHSTQNLYFLLIEATVGIFMANVTLWLICGWCDQQWHFTNSIIPKVAVMQIQRTSREVTWVWRCADNYRHSMPELCRECAGRQVELEYYVAYIQEYSRTRVLCSIYTSIN